MTPDRLHLLIGRCLDGVADQSEHHALAAALRDSDDARYVQECELRQQLVETFDKRVEPVSLPVDRSHSAASLAAWTAVLAASLLIAWVATRPAVEAVRSIADGSDVL